MSLFIFYFNYNNHDNHLLITNKCIIFFINFLILSSYCFLHIICFNYIRINKEVDEHYKKQCVERQTCDGHTIVTVARNGRPHEPEDSVVDVKAENHLQDLNGCDVYTDDRGYCNPRCS